MKIGFFGLEGWEEKIIKKYLPEDDIHLSKNIIDENNIPEESDFEIISIFINSKITEKVLSNFPNLKFITTRSTGFDHIDLETCKKKNITVSYVPGYGDNTVAEFTFGLLLSLTRKIYQAIDQIKESGSFGLSGLRGIDIKEKTIGVVGTGRIGREVIRIANGFSMNIIAYDPYPNKVFQNEIGFEYISFENLLKNSDIITLHCPHTPQTHHLINKGNISLIKKGAYLINTARGGLIETEALIEALNSGILSGAGLDAIEEEGTIKKDIHFLEEPHEDKEKLKTILYDHMLMKMPNVLMTPHNAFNSQEALKRILNTTLDNIKAFKDDTPANLVPEQK
jgi:D-lactate dehydrogenase